MRNIYTITATQIITSDTHPEGLLSDVKDFPITVDSRTYPAPDGNPNGDSDTALIVAQARYHDEIEALTVAKNANRVMWTVTITQANGLQVARKTWGAMPDMTPVPEVEPVVEEGE